MRSFLPVAMLFGLMGTAFGQGQHQGPYWSLGGFGNVLYPGTGHAPTTSYYSSGFAGRAAVASPLVAAHPQHRRATIVPYPVYYGGYGYAGPGYGYDQSQGYTQGNGDQAPPIINTNSAPSVVINQNFVPPQANPSVRDYDSGDTNGDQSGVRLYQVPTPGQASGQRQASDQPTLYLIALKDHTIVQALGYWMEGSTLHYVSGEHSLNQVSLDLIDRDLSQRLNSERNVEFRLPLAR